MIVRKLPPQVFWPKPNVDSAVLKITPNKSLTDRIGNREAFQEFIKAMFMHRRKTLRSQLAAFLKIHASGKSVDEIMGALELAADARAEQLAISQWIEMFKLLGDQATV
jgi:16S rRNA (adenine1518-N6/adenine1519-N6)-dimethyltransferase